MSTTKENNKKSEEYFERAGKKFDLKDFTGAIADYSRAIELNPKVRKRSITRDWRKLTFKISLEQLMTIL